MTPTATQTVSKIEEARRIAGEAHNLVTQRVQERQSIERELAAAEKSVQEHQDAVRTARTLDEVKSATDALVAAQQKVVALKQLRQNLASRIGEAEMHERKAYDHLRTLEGRAAWIRSEALTGQRDVIQQRERKALEIEQQARAVRDAVRQSEQVLADLLREYRDLTGEQVPE